MWQGKMLFFLLCVSTVITAKSAQLDLEAVEVDKAPEISEAVLPPVADKIEETDEETEPKDTTIREWGPSLSQREMDRGRSYLEKNRTHQIEMMRKGLESEKRGMRIIYRSINKRWPNNEVPYLIESIFSEAARVVIASGIDNIMDNTCITFREKVDTDVDWMEIVGVGADGCSARPYFQGPGYGSHKVELEIGGFATGAGTTCVNKGVVVHELLHILGVAHEQQRPDRDQFLTINWPNMKLDMAYNNYKNSWETEDVTSLTKCTATGQQQATANFDNCVSGNTVTAFGIGYDYKSVMHYGLKSFAVDSSINVMTPTDASVGEDDIGGDELSAMDIQKLNRGYFCENSNTKKCGGNIFSATGGTITGETVSGTTTCEYVIRTENGKGIQLNLNLQFAGTCETDYLEVRFGSKKAPLFKKYCKDTSFPTDGLKINANMLYLNWVKTTSTLEGQWLTFVEPCKCDRTKLLNMGGQWVNSIWLNHTANYDGKPVYVYDYEGTIYYLYWISTNNRWNVGGKIGDTSFYMNNELAYNCPEELSSDWNKAHSGLIAAGKMGCADCKVEPSLPECSK